MRNESQIIGILAIVLFLPMAVFAVQISVPAAPGAGFVLISTTTGAYIATTTNPLQIGSLIVSSTTATSTFAGNVNLQRYTLCGPSQPFLEVQNNTGLECWGNDNSINGFQMGVGNRNAGASAYTGFFLNNDQASDGFIDNYGFLGYNSSAYNDNTFGTGTNVKNLLFLQNSNGGVTVESSTTTVANSFINFITGGSASSNERMRITGAGTVGIATTTVGSTPNCTLCVNGTTYSTGWNFFGVSPTGVTGTGGNIVLSSGGASFNGNAVSMPIVRGGTAAGSTHTIEATTNATPNSSSAVIFAYGASAGSESARMVGTTGSWGFGTTSPFWNVTIASSTGPQLALVDGSASSNAWTLRSISNTFYLATSSATATSTTAALAIDQNGNTSFGNNILYVGGNGRVGIGLTGSAGLFSNASALPTDTGGAGPNNASGFVWSTTGATYAAGISNTGGAAGGRNALLVKTAATDNASFALHVDSGLTNPIAVFTAAGNVGIGTSSPQSLLDIQGGGGNFGTATDATTHGILVLRGNAGNSFTAGVANGLEFDNTAQFGWRYAMNDLGNSNAPLSLDWRTGTTWTFGMTYSTKAGGTASQFGVGIGTTTPSAVLDIAGQNNVTIPLLQLSSVTNFATTTQLIVTNAGHISASSTAPTLSGCGTSPTIDGTDSGGFIIIGSAANGCTATFAQPWSKRPECTVVDTTQSLVNAASYTVSATAFVFTETASGGTELDYHCGIGN